MRTRQSFFTLLLTLGLGLFATPAFAGGATKLVLVGGGFRPPAAMRQVAQWGGGNRARALIIGWSSVQPEVYFKTISQDLRDQGVRDFIPSLRGPQSDSEVAEFTRDFLAKLSSATIVFFSGGDQNKHMKVIELPGIREALEAKFGAGFVFVGTSAGTAIMSHTMLTGKGAEVARGLGLAPKDLLIDQHGRREGRSLRVFQAMQENAIPHAILIDENNSIIIEGNQRIRVLGPDWVKVFTLSPSGVLSVEELHNLDEVAVPTWHSTKHCLELLSAA